MDKIIENIMSESNLNTKERPKKLLQKGGLVNFDSGFDIIRRPVRIFLDKNRFFIIYNGKKSEIKVPPPYSKTRESGQKYILNRITRTIKRVNPRELTIDDDVILDKKSIMRPSRKILSRRISRYRDKSSSTKISDDVKNLLANKNNLGEIISMIKNSLLKDAKSSSGDTIPKDVIEAKEQKLLKSADDKNQAPEFQEHKMLESKHDNEEDPYTSAEKNRQIDENIRLGMSISEQQRQEEIARRLKLYRTAQSEEDKIPKTKRDRFKKILAGIIKNVPKDELEAAKAYGEIRKQIIKNIWTKPIGNTKYDVTIFSTLTGRDKAINQLVIEANQEERKREEEEKKNSIIKNIKDAEHESIMSSYNDITPEEREEMNRLLAENNNFAAGKISNVPLDDIDNGQLPGLWNYQIDEYFKNEPKYLGTIGSDQIEELATTFKKKINGQHKLVAPNTDVGFIMNTRPVGDKETGHWIAVYIKPNDSVEYFDSFGDEPSKETDEEIKKLLEKWHMNTLMKYKVNTIQQQNNDTQTCGYHAIRFLQDRFDGIPFPLTTRFDNSIKGENKINRTFALI